jgi:hypothetical protein
MNLLVAVDNICSVHLPWVFSGIAVNVYGSNTSNPFTFLYESYSKVVMLINKKESFTHWDHPVPCSVSTLVKKIPFIDFVSEYFASP